MEDLYESLRHFNSAARRNGRTPSSARLDATSTPAPLSSPVASNSSHGRRSSSKNDSSSPGLGLVDLHDIFARLFAFEKRLHDVADVVGTLDQFSSLSAALIGAPWIIANAFDTFFQKANEESDETNGKVPFVARMQGLPGRSVEVMMTVKEEETEETGLGVAELPASSPTEESRTVDDSDNKTKGADSENDGDENVDDDDDDDDLGIREETGSSSESETKDVGVGRGGDDDTDDDPETLSEEESVVRGGDVAFAHDDDGDGERETNVAAVLQDALAYLISWMSSVCPTLDVVFALTGKSGSLFPSTHQVFCLKMEQLEECLCKYYLKVSKSNRARKNGPIFFRRVSWVKNGLQVGCLIY